MPSFGRVSTGRLDGLCDELTLVANDVIKILDHSIIETSRGREKQDRYFDTGVSTLRWPQSKHNVTKVRPKSDALDVWPYVPPFGALSGHPDQVKAIARQTGRTEGQVSAFIYKAFARLAGAYEACGAARGFAIRWGGDWDGDGNLLDQSFHDLPHIETVRT